jgi:hypothetical protein
MKIITILVFILLPLIETQAQFRDQLLHKIAGIDSITDNFNSSFKANKGIGCSIAINGGIREWDSTAHYTLSYNFNEIDWKSSFISQESDDVTCIEISCKAQQACISLLNEKQKKKTYRNARVFCLPDEEKQKLNTIHKSLIRLIPYFE